MARANLKARDYQIDLAAKLNKTQVRTPTRLEGDAHLAASLCAAGASCISRGGSSLMRCAVACPL